MLIIGAALGFSVGMPLGYGLSQHDSDCPTARELQAKLDSLGRELDVGQYHVARIRQDQAEIADALRRRRHRVGE